MIVLGGDLETDNDGENPWVVQWCIHDGVNECHGQDVDELFNELLIRMRKDDVVIYFHNLKHDLSFLQNKLGEFIDYYDFILTPVIRDNSPILIKLESRDEELHELQFRDSTKKLPGSLHNVGKLINLPKLKGFDFYPGWSKEIDFSLSSNWDYVIRDAEIVAKAMIEMHNDGFTKSTISGDAWKIAKESITSIDKKSGSVKNGFLKWNYNYPSIDYDLDKMFRKGYYGGLNISRHKGYCEGPITHADVVSMYPSIMYYEELPYGEPIKTKDKPSGSLYIVKGEYKLKLKPEAKGLAWFTFKNKIQRVIEGLSIGDPVVETHHYHELVLTSVDFNTLSRWYDIEINPEVPEEYWRFKSGVGMFRPFIDRFIKEKTEAPKDSLKRAKAKRILNSLYGRFGLNPEIEDNYLIYDPVKNDYNWLSMGVTNHDNKAYLPFAMFTTAYAREKLLDYVAMVGVENVIHCDTDSVIHFGGKVEGIKYGKELGDWDIERNVVKMWEGGFKRYVEQIDDEITGIRSINIAAAGVSRKFNDDDVPSGMWVEIIDDPSIITVDQELGSEHYKIKSKWLRDLYIKNNMNPDDVNTMKLIGVIKNGGTIFVERKHKLSDSLIVRRGR